MRPVLHVGWWLLLLVHPILGPHYLMDFVYCHDYVVPMKILDACVCVYLCGSTTTSCSMIVRWEYNNCCCCVMYGSSRTSMFLQHPIPGCFSKPCFILPRLAHISLLVMWVIKCWVKERVGRIGIADLASCGTCLHTKVTWRGNVFIIVPRAVFLCRNVNTAGSVICSQKLQVFLFLGQEGYMIIRFAKAAKRE